MIHKLTVKLKDGINTITDEVTLVGEELELKSTDNPDLWFYTCGGDAQYIFNHDNIISIFIVSKEAKK